MEDDSHFKIGRQSSSGCRPLDLKEAVANMLLDAFVRVASFMTPNTFPFRLLDLCHF